MRDELSLVLIAAATPTGAIRGVGLHRRATILQQNHPVHRPRRSAGLNASTVAWDEIFLLTSPERTYQSLPPAASVKPGCMWRIGAVLTGNLVEERGRRLRGWVTEGILSHVI